MLTVKYRFNERFRPIQADPQFLTLRKEEPIPPPPPIVINEPEPEPIVEPPKEVNENDLWMEQILQLEEENRNLHRENLLFARYLHRTQASKLIETFADYENERQWSNLLDELDSTKSPRRASVRRSFTHSPRGSLSEPKLPTERRPRGRSQIFSIVEQERLLIAAYECEQTRLELERMITNRDTTLDEIKLLFRIALSDENNQARLNREVEQYVDRYRLFIGDREFRNPRLKVPAKLVISRINQRVYSRVSMIGQVRMSNIHLRTRLNETNFKIRDLNELYNRMDDVDITFAISNTQRINNLEKYETLHREYLSEKSGQYPVQHRLQQYKALLDEEEKSLADIMKKMDILQHISRETQREIDALQEDNTFIVEENAVLKPRLESLQKVPTIIDYAYTIKQTKFLQQEIEKWAKRVNMVEAFLSQLQQQSRSTRFLPSLQVNRPVQPRAPEPVPFPHH